MLPRARIHDKGTAYARSGLFKALKTIAELELRIAPLPTAKEQGLLVPLPGRGKRNMRLYQAGAGWGATGFVIRGGGKQPWECWKT